MNDTTSAPAGRLAWPDRLGIFIQHGAEYVILGLVLIAVCISTSTLSPWSNVFGSSNLLSWLASDFKRCLLGFLCGAAVLIPLTWMACRETLAEVFARTFRLGTRRPVLGISMAGVLILAAIYCYLWPRMFPPARSYGQSDFISDINFADTVTTGSLLALVILLILSRLCRRALTFHLAVLVIFGLLLGAAYWFKVRPVILVIRHDFELAQQTSHQALIKPGLMISYLFLPLRAVLEILIPFLAALYAIRRGFAWWKVVLGWAAGWLMTYGALFLSLPPASRATALLVATNLGLVVLLLRLPLQRRALGRLTGLCLSGTPGSLEAPVSGTLAALPGHALLLVLGLGLVAFSILGTYEKQMVQILTIGPPAPHYSPALVNAYEVMKPWFDRQKAKPLSQRMSDDYVLLEQMGATPRPLMEEVRQFIDSARVESDINSLNPALELYVKATGADYCLFHEAGRAVIPHFLNLRKVARALQARANLRIMQGRPAEALADMETNLKIAWLMNGDPNGTLVHHMIAAAIRGIALPTAQNYFYYYRQDPAALGQLRALLERDARLVRIDFPNTILERTEPGFWSIVPCFEVAVPGFIKAVTEFYNRWTTYDAVLIATALEAYRNDHGNYPDRLEQLAPQYLAKLPREPLVGKPYIYERTATGFSLGHPVTGEADRKQVDFSTDVKENFFVRKSLDQLKAPKTTAAGSPAR